MDDEPESLLMDPYLALPPLPFQQILSSLDSRSLAIAGCISRSWKAITGLPNLWERHCEVRMETLIHP